MDAFLAGLTSDQWEYWSAYLESEPLPDQRADYYRAQLAAVTFNMLRGKGERARQVKDFLLEFGPAETEPQDVRAALMTWVRAVGQEEGGRGGGNDAG